MATEQVHARVERLVARYAPLTSREGYIRYLRAMHILHNDFERQDIALGGAVRVHGEALQSRAALIEQDLAELDVAPLNQAIQVFNFVQNIAQLLGAAYVIEGSMLGTNAIRRVLERHSQAAIILNGRFINLNKLKRGADWRQYLRILDETELDQADIGDMCWAAITAFQQAERCLMRVGGKLAA